MFLKDKNNFTVSKADTFTTARTINGTSFNGSANITTANWGTARTLTIGSTGKSVNGSANVTWTLSEIGAAAASHTHSYLPLSGGTLTGSVKNSLNTGTWLAGNQGTALLSSTNTAGNFTTLIKSNSTNGYFGLSNYQNSFYLTYTAKTTVDAGTNTTTKQAVLLNESGNTTFPGTVTAPTFSGALSGNATTATTATKANTLTTARTINGTSFNGSANITTANWGTARTLTIGNTGKSVNGSGNVSWSLSEIGAAASSHGYHVPTACDSVSDWNSATRNGWFMAHNAANAPMSDKWYMGCVIAHNGNYVIQQVYEFTAAGVDIQNIPMYTRVKYNGTWGSWKQHYTVSCVPGSYWSKNVVVGGDGVVEVGRYMDWHFTNNSTADYDVRWQMTDAGTIESTGVLGAPAMKIGGNRVHVSSGTPSSPPVGTVWIQI